MFTPGWSLKWSIAVLLGQAALVVVALYLCCVQTILDWNNGPIMGMKLAGYRTYYRGWPVPWLEERRDFIKDLLLRDADEGGPFHEWQPVKTIGIYPPAPIAMLAIAITLPPVLARTLRWEVHFVRGIPQPPLLRLDRNLRRVLVCSVGILFACWLVFLVCSADQTRVPEGRSEEPCHTQWQSSH